MWPVPKSVAKHSAAAGQAMPDIPRLPTTPAAPHVAPPSVETEKSSTTSPRKQCVAAAQLTAVIRLGSRLIGLLHEAPPSPVLSMSPQPRLLIQVVARHVDVLAQVML